MASIELVTPCTEWRDEIGTRRFVLHWSAAIVALNPSLLAGALAHTSQKSLLLPLQSAGLRVFGYDSAFSHLRIPMAQFVYTMRRVGKVVPPKRTVLKNISLSFFPGAKIGVLGLNGAGKSSLLKIMAGEDTNFDGEAIPMPNMRVGFLPQEPQLDPDKTVREMVEEGLGEIFEAKQKLDEIYAAYAEEGADFDSARGSRPSATGARCADRSRGRPSLRASHSHCEAASSRSRSPSGRRCRSSTRD
jgi:hypothetical protein